MQLRLKVSNSLAAQLGKNAEFVFGQNGGTIGRAAHNDWILPDAKRFVSSVHASIEVRDDDYYLVDTSMNGVFVNGSKTALGPTQPYRLNEGDKLRFGNYRIRVMSNDIVLNDDQQTLLNGDVFDDAVDAEPSSQVSVEFLVDEEISDPLDLASLLEDDLQLEPSTQHNAFGADDELADDLMAIVNERPSMQASGHSAKVMQLRSKPKPTASKPRDTKATGSGDAYTALLDGLGITADAVAGKTPAQIAFTIGKALRESVNGQKLMRQNRARIRQALTLSPSQQEVDDLVPSNIDDDIVDLLLGRGNLHQEMSDNLAHESKGLLHHQVALASATREAFKEFLSKIDPEDLVQRVEANGKSGLFPSTRKARFWEQYCLLYELLTHSADGNLPSLFNEEFARAYSAQIKTLEKTERGISGSPD